MIPEIPKREESESSFANNLLFNKPSIIICPVLGFLSIYKGLSILQAEENSSKNTLLGAASIIIIGVSLTKSFIMDVKEIFVGSKLFFEYDYSPITKNNHINNINYKNINSFEVKENEFIIDVTKNNDNLTNNDLEKFFKALVSKLEYEIINNHLDEIKILVKEIKLPGDITSLAEAINILNNSLMLAIKYNNIDALLYFLEIGVRITEDALLLAIRNQDNKIFKILIENGAKIEDHILDYAIINEDLNIIKTILESNDNIFDNTYYRVNCYKSKRIDNIKSCYIFINGNNYEIFNPEIASYLESKITQRSPEEYYLEDPNAKIDSLVIKEIEMQALMGNNLEATI